MRENPTPFEAAVDAIVLLMITATVLFFSSCSTTVPPKKISNVKNYTDTWTDHDQKVLRSAMKTCFVKYGVPLKYFIKVEERNYQAICGENESK